MLFRSPKIVEAIQWFPGVVHERVVEKNLQIGKTYFHAYLIPWSWPDDLPVGLKAGDWVVEGETHPLSDYIFKTHYEPIVEPPKIDEIDIDVPEPSDASKIKTETLTIRPSRRQQSVQGKTPP